MKKNIVIFLVLGIIFSIAFILFTTRYTSAETDNQGLKSVSRETEKAEVSSNISKTPFEETASLEDKEGRLDRSNMVNKESNQQKAYEIFGLKLEDMGIHNVELSSLENSEKNEALIELANLKNTGSLSGGVQTTEFDESMINVAKDNFNAIGKDANKIKEKLTFEPVFLNNFYGAKLVGVNNSGVLTKNKYDISYQVYDINYGQSGIELTEQYIPKNGVVRLTVVKDFLNDTVNNKPARLESLYSDKQEQLYNLSWQNNERYYELNTRNLPLVGLQEIARFIDLNSTNIQSLEKRKSS
jgi:hypothetical protein